MSAQQALRLIDTHKVTRAILDMRLGNEDSIPVAQRLEAAAVPFILYTGNRDKGVWPRHWPQAPIVTKPASPETIIAALVAVAKK